MSSWGSKLVVDGTSEIVRSDLLTEAVRDLAASQSNPGGGGRVVELQEWILKHYEGPLLHLKDVKEGESISKKKGFCTDVHCVDVYEKDGIHHYALCGVCGQRVQTKSPVYTCRFCSLAIHL